MAKLLLRRSPDHSVRAGIFGTPLHASVFYGWSGTTARLLSKSKGHLTPATVDHGGRIPLHMAAMSDRKFLIDDLTTDGASFLTRDLGGRHSLHFAAGHGSTEFARLILDRHQDAIQDADADGWTPLQWACRQDSTNMIGLLISRGADKEAETRRGWKPVHVAMYHRAIFWHPEKVIELVKSSLQTIEETPSAAGPVNSDSSSRSKNNDVFDNDDEEKLPVKTAKQACSSPGNKSRCSSCQCVRISYTIHQTTILTLVFIRRSVDLFTAV